MIIIRAVELLKESLNCYKKRKWRGYKFCGIFHKILTFPQF